MQLGTDTSAAANQIFQVRADPNGLAYRNSGSAVMGCFNPVTSTSEVYEFSAAASQKGPQAQSQNPFRTC